MQLTVTLPDLVSAVSEFASDENEIAATVLHLIYSGRVRLAGSSPADEFIDA